MAGRGAERRSDVSRRGTTRAAPEVAGRAVSTLVLSLAGIAVSGYLAWTKLAGAHALFCSAAGGCDVVQASHYATLLGAPTALWGTALYAVIAVLAWRGLTPRRWFWALVATCAGVAFSAFLTAVSIAVLRATCGYCILSGVILVAILVDVIRRRRSAAGRHAGPSPSRLAAVGAGTAVATVLAALAIFGSAPADTTSYQVALARHLAGSHAVMYGAYWCPHCREQKELFGGAASLLPYVECDPKGSAARPDLCERAEVRSYPTWVIGDQRLEGVQPLEALARASGFSS